MSENFESTYESTIPNQDFWEDDGISLTGNPYYSPDQIVFTGSRLPGLELYNRQLSLLNQYLEGFLSVQY